MDTFPNYKMFALLKDNYVIDAVLGGPDLYVSARNNKITYNNIKNQYDTILVTIENSPIQIGDYFNGKKFINKVEKEKV
jgi:hypothetical protein